MALDWITGIHLYLLHHGAENTLCILPRGLVSHLLCRLPLVLPVAWRFQGQYLSPESRLPSFAFAARPRGSQTLLSVSKIRVELFHSLQKYPCRSRRLFWNLCGHAACYYSSIDRIKCVVSQHDHTCNLFDQVSFVWTCIRAIWKCVSRIHWHPELNVNVPWSWIVQTNFHSNDLYAAGICTDEMPFKSILYSSSEPLYFCIEPLLRESPASNVCIAAHSRY